MAPCRPCKRFITIDFPDICIRQQKISPDKLCSLKFPPDCFRSPCISFHFTRHIGIPLDLSLALTTMMEFPSGVNCKAEYVLDCPMCAGIASEEALKYIGDTFDRTRHTGNDARHCSTLRIHHFFSALDRKSVPGCIQIQILPFRNVCITARLHLTPQNLLSIAATTPRASADLPGVPGSRVSPPAHRCSAGTSVQRHLHAGIIARSHSAQRDSNFPH